MVTSRTESTLHRRGVRILVRWFKDQGWKVTQAATDAYPDPRAVGRHEPDAIALNANSVWVYGEVKTGERDIGTQHSREQYKDFSHRVMKRNNRPCPFYVLIPKRHQAELNRVLKELGVLSRPNVHILTFS